MSGDFIMKVSEERLNILRTNSSAKHSETLNCIKSALLTLMEQKKYDNISMTEIIQKSGVSRAGVYYNYKCKDEILLDIIREPVDEAISCLTDSIFDNMEMVFRIGEKYKSSFSAVLSAGLEHEFLTRMNKHYENETNSFYFTMWNGMIYNAFIEWARAGMPGGVETAIDKVKEGLKLVSASIEKGLRN